MRFTSIASPHFAGSRLSEAIAEAGLTVAAAGFTAALWLAVGAWVIEPESSIQAARTAQPEAVRHVTLPTVVIVGRRDALEATPVMTTAQNTAAIPVNLK